jgi:predicted enzyme related to lactoylglutathione lyase
VSVPRAAAFYSSVFGWEFTDANSEGYSTFSTGPSGIGGGIYRAQKVAAGGGVVMYVLVDDVDDYCKKVSLAGGTVIVPKSAIPGTGWYAHIKDIDGNLIGLLMTLNPGA